ncbi:MAG: molecular chaperone HscB [Pseudomonadota bacterium]|nr:molecular chaperone HscB [Pseudomonadota bacterium]
MNKMNKENELAKLHKKLYKILTEDAFTVFEIPPNFDLMSASTPLNNKLHELQKKFHPDNWTSNPSIYGLITRVSSHINSCYQELKNPLSRSLLLLKLNGFHLDLAKNTQMPQAFLFEQMEFHELLDEAANDCDKLEQLEQNLENKQKTVIEELGSLFNQKQFEQALELTKQLSFYQKLADLISRQYP